MKIAPLKIATWNVNSVRARLDRLVDWLNTRAPDIVLLQETKCEEHQFPREAVGDCGYEVVHYGQKTYNGVAVLSKTRPQETVRGFADGQEEDPSRRILWASFPFAQKKLWVASVYAPNGQAVGTDKYAYKLAWYARFARTLPARLAGGDLVLLGGDYNVAPADIDVHDPVGWRGQVLVSDGERAALNGLLATGFVDTFRVRHPEVQAFTWWDYRMLAFAKNKGLRIDHFLANPLALQACTQIEVDREARQGENPSDHAPVMAILDENAFAGSR